MGLNLHYMKWLLLMKRKHGVDFGRTAMLGRQSLVFTQKQSLQWYREAMPLCFDLSKLVQPDGFTENFWKQLAAVKDASIDSVDFSTYEGANIILDLNEPLPQEHHGRWSAVYDGGTLEHVFNFPQSVRNAMSMPEPGGHLLLGTITDGWCNHGFYQFSPTLFFSLFTEENGYELLDMTISLKDNEKDAIFLRMLRDPGPGMGTFSVGRVSLLICAKRIGGVPEHLKLQQRFFEAAWEGAGVQGRGPWYEQYDIDRELADAKGS